MRVKTLHAVFILLSLITASAVFSIASSASSTSSSFFFSENRGQFETDVLFRSENSGNTVWVLENEIWFTVLDRSSETVITEGPLNPQGASTRALNLRLTFPENSPESEWSQAGSLSTIRNYLTPQGQFNRVPLWEEVRLKDLQVGLDLSIREENGAAVLFFEGRNAFSPSVLDLTVEGANEFVVMNGEAVAKTDLGDYILPVRSDIPGFTVRLSSGIGEALVYTLPSSDPAPEAAGQHSAGTLVYSTYYGANGSLEYGSQTALDSSGGAFFAGGADAPVLIRQPGIVNPLHLVKAFIVKLSPDGTTADYITTISGTDPNGEDFATGIVLDDSGNAYISGLSSSTDFPATAGAYDVTPNGGFDAWFAKINGSGSVVFASLLGTPASEWANAVGLGTGNEIYVTGFTSGNAFPTTGGAYDVSHNGGFDVFVSKFNNAGSTLLASTFIGGSANDGGDIFLDRSDIFIDGNGSVYITGPTRSSNYPTTAPRIGPGGCNDIYVSRFDAALSTLVLSNRIGGSGATCGSDGEDNGEKMAVDGAGNIYITGYTSTANGSFPVAGSAFDTSFNGFFDAFLIKLNPGGNTLLYGTFLGGSGLDVAKDLTLDPAGNVYVTGYTTSTGFPLSASPFDPSLNGGVDAFLTKIYPGRNGACDLRYSTFIGGGNADYGTGIALRGSHGVYITGQTLSGNFPIVPGSYDTTYSGDADGFMLRLDLLPTLPVPTWTPAPYDLYVPITSNNAGC